MASFQNFADFYQYYLQQHSDPRCRSLHYLGSTLVWAGLLLVVVLEHYWLLPALPIVGYGCAWWGHYRYEHNQPATFQHPLYSFAADWVMYWEWIKSKGKLPGT